MSYVLLGMANNCVLKNGFEKGDFMTRSLSTRNATLPSTLRNDFFGPLESVFDDFFHDFFKGTSALDKVKSTGGFPKLDILEDSGYLVVKAAMPGVPAEDIKVELDKNILRISGKFEEHQEHKDDPRYYVKELTHRAFTREVVLPDWVKEDPEAVMKDGLLKLSWKLPEDKQNKASPRLIEVKREQ